MNRTSLLVAVLLVAEGGCASDTSGVSLTATPSPSSVDDGEPSGGAAPKGGTASTSDTDAQPAAEVQQVDPLPLVEIVPGDAGCGRPAMIELPAMIEPDDYPVEDRAATAEGEVELWEERLISGRDRKPAAFAAGKRAARGGATSEPRAPSNPFR